MSLPLSETEVARRALDQALGELSEAVAMYCRRLRGPTIYGPLESTGGDDASASVTHPISSEASDVRESPGTLTDPLLTRLAKRFLAIFK